MKSNKKWFVDRVEIRNSLMFPLFPSSATAINTTHYVERGQYIPSVEPTVIVKSKKYIPLIIKYR
jgi:hypothetical protein